jgi:hypothetical protein
VYSVAGVRERDVLLAPYQRSFDRTVVGVAVQDNAGITIEARICAILPESGAVCIRIRDAVESEGGDCEEELDYEEGVHQAGKAPVSGHEESGSRHLGQLVVGVCRYMLLFRSGGCLV